MLTYSTVIVCASSLDSHCIISTSNWFKCYSCPFLAYHLYTVVPRLVKFIDYLTNVYVRMNRKRLRVGIFCINFNLYFLWNILVLVDFEVCLA